jgi:hypothetical protein
LEQPEAAVKIPKDVIFFPTKYCLEHQPSSQPYPHGASGVHRRKMVGVVAKSEGEAQKLQRSCLV